VALSALTQRRPTPKSEGTQEALKMGTRRRGGEESAKSMKMRKCEKEIETDWKGNLTGAPAADAKISGVWKGEEIEKCEEKQKKSFWGMRRKKLRTPHHHNHHNPIVKRVPVTFPSSFLSIRDPGLYSPFLPLPSVSKRGGQTDTHHHTTNHKRSNHKRSNLVLIQRKYGKEEQVGEKFGHGTFKRQDGPLVGISV